MVDMVVLTIEGSVARLTLNRPERHNSLVPELLRDMLSCLEDVRGDPQVRIVLLNASGRSFSTGGDIRGFYDHLQDLEAYSNEVVGLLNKVILEMMVLPVPIVTAVHGIVTGGSLGLILASDIIVMTPEASITPYYNVVGFSPDGGWTAILPSIIGAKRTFEILATNRTIAASEAIHWGLASMLVPGEDIHNHLANIIDTLLSMKPGSLRSTKRLLNMDRETFAEKLKLEQKAFVSQVLTDEARYGIRSFLGLTS